MTKRVWPAILYVLVAVTCSTNALAVSYSVRYLSTPTGFRAPRATAINAFGLIAGTAQDAIGRQHAFVWESDGISRELLMPAGYTSCFVSDMNVLGQCVGFATDSSDNRHAVAWGVDGTARDLGALDGVDSMARGINGSGQIAGWSGAPDGSVHAVLWNMAGGFVDLGQTYGWSWSRIHGINDSGEIAGGRPGGAFVLSGDSLRDLGAQIGDAPFSEAIAINSVGDAVGGHTGTGGTPILWRSDGTVVCLDTAGYSVSYAWSINSAAQVVGWCYLSQPFPLLDVSHAVIWDQDGLLTDLNPTGTVSSTAYDINDNGWIVGSCSDNSASYAAVWVPVPEPTSCLALVVGVALLPRFGRLRRPV